MYARGINENAINYFSQINEMKPFLHHRKKKKRGHLKT